MHHLLAATNVNDVLVAAIITIPAILAAVASLLAWRSSRSTKNSTTEIAREVRSPNGSTSGETIHSVSERLKDVVTKLNEVRATQIDHDVRDEQRFGALYGHLQVEDPMPPQSLSPDLGETA